MEIMVLVIRQTAIQIWYDSNVNFFQGEKKI